MNCVEDQLHPMHNCTSGARTIFQRKPPFVILFIIVCTLIESFLFGRATTELLLELFDVMVQEAFGRLLDSKVSSLTRSGAAHLTV